MELKAYKITFIVFALLPFALFAKKAEYEASKHFEESYSIGKGHVFDLDGSFASFEVITWNQDEVHISGDITVTAKNQAKADEMINEYDVQMSNSNSKVRLKVSLNSNGKDKNYNKAESIVKFIIKAPEWLQIEAQVTFGNLDLASHSADNSIEMEYGNLSAVDLTGSNNVVKMSFGNISLERFGGGELTALFSNMEIDELMGNSTLENSYSTSQFHSIHKDVKDMTIGNSFGETTLSIPNQHAYEIESGSSFGSLKVEGPWNEKHYSSEFDSEQKEGTFGKGALVGTIRINNSFGSVNVKEK